MTDEEAEINRSMLCDVLADTEQFLHRYGVAHWPAKLADARNLIESDDFRGVDIIRSTFGGMGSFNDVYLHPINGHLIAEDKVASVNEQFQTLGSQIIKLAETLNLYMILRGSSP